MMQATTSSPAIPFKRDADPASAALGGGAIGILVLSLVAIGVVLYLRKRLGLDRPAHDATRRMKVLETSRLGPRALLSVVEFDGREHLLAHGEHGVQLLVSANREAA